MAGSRAGSGTGEGAGTGRPTRPATDPDGAELWVKARWAAMCLPSLALLVNAGSTCRAPDYPGTAPKDAYPANSLRGACTIVGRYSGKDRALPRELPTAWTAH